MSKILITGNGFDLFHHLPTKYHHFISIMQTIEENQFGGEVSFDALFGGLFKIRHQFEYNLIEENYNSNNIKFSHEKLNRIRQLLEINLWYKHFKTILEIDTWIDFEMEIESILNQLIYFSDIKNKSDLKRNAFVDKFNVPNEFELFGIINIIQKDFSFRLNEKYINQRKNSINIKKILDDLAKSFEDFIVIFNLYLVDVVSVFYAETKQESSIPFYLMDEIYTFNYTPTLEKFYNINKSKVVYLHGQINDDCDKQNIVLGISEMPKDVKVNKMFDFTKYYQKIRKNSNNKFIEIPEKKSYQENETIFYIIGHSLDESDKEYIDDLFKFLNFDLGKEAKICVFYHDLNDKEGKLKNLFSIIDKEIIVNMNKDKRLYFVKLNQQNIKEEFTRKLYDKYEGYRA